MKLTNNFEGGSVGATVATANTGGTGNTPVDGVTIQNTGTATFTATAAHGSLAVQVVNEATKAAWLEWNASITSQAGSGVSGTLYTRLGLRLPSLPASELAVIRGVSTGGAQRWRVCVDATGHVLVRDGGNNLLATSATALTTGTWWRIEAAMAAPNTTAGTAEVRIYAGDATVPTETIGPLSALNLGGPVFAVRYGHCAATTQVSTLLVDDAGVSDEGWLGPAIAVPQVRHVWVGGLTDTSVLVSYGSANVASGQLVVSTTADLATAPITGSAVAADAYGNMLLPVDGLAPDTQYFGGILADGVLLATGRCQFLTDPPAGQQVSFSFAFGSCQQTNSNSLAYAAILAHAGQFGLARRFCHEGDLNYADLGAGNTRDDVIAQYRSSIAPSNVAALQAKLAMTYSWDNHDFGGVDSNALTPRAADFKLAYRSFVPHYPLADDDQAAPSGAIYQTWVIGRVRFIDLDTRSERSDRTDPETVDKVMLSPQQEAWLYEQLLAPEPVKIICSGIYWRQDAVNGDRWGSYSTQWTRIKQWFQAHPQVNAYVICGDRHALAADNGTSPGCYLPQADGAALDQGSTAASEAWTAGYYDTGGANLKAFGWVDVVDAGSSITLNYTGFTAADGVARVQMSTSFPVVSAGNSGAWGIPL